MAKQLHEMDFRELADEQAGRALQALGAGTSMRAIVVEAMGMAFEWKRAVEAHEATKAQGAAKKGTNRGKG